VADKVVTDCALPSLFGQVDEIHVLTSLTGFEALLRGKTVVTYGQPFYAGWGLTRDFGLSPEVAARRSRSLSLDELVAATLILYPTYVSRRSGRFTTPERVLDELFEWRVNGATKPSIGDYLNRWVGRLFAN
jgi:capsular polysaccharide export protein